jgi:hypothetical protein
MGYNIWQWSNYGWRSSVYEKDFEGWHRLKQSTEEDAPCPTFNDREVWWCSVGVNIGHEIDGKDNIERFVIKKAPLSELFICSLSPASFGMQGRNCA